MAYSLTSTDRAAIFADQNGDVADYRIMTALSQVSKATAKPMVQRLAFYPCYAGIGMSEEEYRACEFNRTM